MLLATGEQFEHQDGDRYAAMGKSMYVAIAVAVWSLLANSAPCAAPNPSSGQTDSWEYYGHDPGGTRYSPLVQINRDNVANLKVAWIYHTGDVSNGDRYKRKSGFENTPIVVDGTMYITSPFNRVIALDPETGAERWKFDPHIELNEGYYADGLINRGVSTWLDPTRPPGDPCHRRIFVATIDARLIALDAANGHVCEDFGQYGQIDLKRGVKNIERSQYYGEYEETSPPAIIDDLVVVGSAIGDNRAADEPLGTVRAFDVRTGALKWSWNPIPQSPDDPAWREWREQDVKATGAANVWAPISTDAQNDLIFLPVSSASPDYYGGNRLGSDLYADSIVALQAKTGRLAWYFQTTHHDLWDYDNPAQPMLCTIRRHSRNIPAVVQATKRGSLFIFNRITGEPVFPIVEKSVPQSNVPGEQTAPTQPFPVLPPPLARQSLTADDAFGVTWFDNHNCRTRMAKLRAEGIFTPPSLNGSLVVPGNAGGMNWSGVAYDPVRQLLVTNLNNMASDVHLIPRAEMENAMNASRGFDLEFAPQQGTPYGMSRVFMRSSYIGLLCTPPPWGILTAVDLSSGQIRWSVPLGNAGALIRSLTHIPFPDPHWGLPNLGGAIITGGGLVFIAAGFGDPHLRAFDIDTGKLLWTGELPAAGNATPMTYRISSAGKQYVVIAAGGHSKFDAPRSDALVAFALP
jgi:quinoprotein glucose dehydrogenase